MEARTGRIGPEPKDDDDEDVGPVEAQVVGKRSSAVAEAEWISPTTAKVIKELSDDNDRFLRGLPLAPHYMLELLQRSGRIQDLAVNFMLSQHVSTAAGAYVDDSDAQIAALAQSHEGAVEALSVQLGTLLAKFVGKDLLTSGKIADRIKTVGEICK
jgi:hypothetical protein